MVTEALRTSRLPSGCCSTLRLGAALLSAGFAMQPSCPGLWLCCSAAGGSEAPMQQALGCKGRMVHGEDGAWKRRCKGSCKGRTVREEDGAWRRWDVEFSPVSGEDCAGGGWCTEKTALGQNCAWNPLWCMGMWGDWCKERAVHEEGNAKGGWCIEKVLQRESSSVPEEDGAWKGQCMERVVHRKDGAQRRHAVCGWQGVGGSCGCPKKK